MASNETADEMSSEASANRSLPSICVIHVVPTEKSRLLPWQKESWEIVQRSAKARKASKNFQTSKHRGVVEALPAHPRDGDGYHSKCYKNFTAISTLPLSNENDSVGQGRKVLRSALSSVRNSREASISGTSNVVGIFPDTCLFCDKKVKKRPDGTKELPGKLLTMQGAKKILEIAHTLKLGHLLAKVSGVDLIAKGAKFHHSCRSTFIRKADRVKGFGLPSITEEAVNPQFPLDCIYSYVKCNVIDRKRPERLTSIYEQYTDLCTEFEVVPGVSKAQYLGDLLTRRFPDMIAMHSPACRFQGVIVHSTAIDYQSIKVVYDFKSSPEGQITKAALHLRQALKAVTKKQLPDPLTVTALKNGEGDPPDLVNTFFRNLLGGPDTGSYSESVKRRSDSLSQDVLFLVQNGKLKTRKHIMMGMSLKSLTGSKKIVTLLNRMGHSLSYHAIEEIETELAYGILDRKMNCPSGAIPGIPCGLAFDNYDEVTHTLSGADTLHDTMGIMYQIHGSPVSVTHCEGQNEDVTDEQVTERLLPSLMGKKKKRKLDVPGVALAPYKKRPRMDNFSYAKTDYRGTGSEISIPPKQLDFLWMVTHVLEMENIPMWTGFNALNYVDRLPSQVVLYMPNIDRSPTNDDVVLETLSITQKCARECGQPYGVVTYDLDVAKRALRIQVTERPRFDDIFIMFGSFHLQMCLFKAIGKIVKESGMAEMLVEADVLAPGSLNSFLDCTNFNRCKRLHPMLALALETMHFRQFCSTYHDIDNVTTLIKGAALDNNEAREQLCTVPEFTMLFEEYSRYVQSTLDGKHGPTARFFLQHIQRVNLYHIIDRAIRESNLDLYIWALTQAIDIFFWTNRQNYARWMSKHQLDLMNIGTTHPGLKEMLVDGLFSIRRTTNQFSRLPVDLTLEQTINADAASRMTGYTSATNNFSARSRWCVTKSARAAITSAMLEMAGMNISNDAQAELTPKRVSRDNKDMRKLLKTIEGFSNPFSLDSEFLVNMQTGKAATKDITDSLLSVEEKGRQKHDEFVSECIDDAARFEKPIAQNRLKTFADQGAKSKKTNSPILQELRCTRDLFGRIAIIAVKREVDLEYLLGYPLTPVPLTMCTTDGTMVTMSHGTKSDLFTLLESRVTEHGSPTKVKATVIDGNFLLHCLPPNLPTTYGGLSRYLLHAVLSHPSKRVDILFDTYEEPTIKDNEREQRGVEYSVYRITSPEQIRPRNIEKALKSTSFKQQLPRFLVKNWREQWYSTILDGREVYVGVDTDCFVFKGIGGVVDVTTAPRLDCNHPEADTRICLHARDVDSTIQDPGDIVVRATDTDIAVILLHHLHRMKAKLWMDVGTCGKGNRRYINLSAIGSAIGSRLCKALPGFHAFTGCDYTSFFVRKGKKRPLKIAEESDAFLDAFSALTTENVDEETRKVLEEYTTKLYGAKKTTSLNKHRFEVFEKSFGPRYGKHPFARLKGVNACSIPPCENEVQQKIHRSNFVAMTWHDAYKNTIPKEPQQGWELVGNCYQPVWFTCAQMPDSVVPNNSDLEVEEDDDNFPGGSEYDTDSQSEEDD